MTKQNKAKLDTEKAVNQSKDTQPGLEGPGHDSLWVLY